MKVINIEVTDQLKVTSIKDGETVLNSSLPVKIASGNYKSVILNFDFKTKTWDETTLNKYATFNIDGQERIQVGLEKIGEYEFACYMPYAVAKQNCKANIGVYGASIINGEVKKIVSSENLYFLIVDGSFSVFLSDETPPKIETMEEIIQKDIDSYVDDKTKTFNNNYQTKLDNINANILTAQEDTTSGIVFNEYADSKRIENSISNYFSMTPDDKIYTVKFPLFETSNTSTGEKLDDNADRYCHLATDTIREDSNYGPAWESIDCNATVDKNGVRHITALKGMSTFKDTGRVDVFCLFRTYYQKIWEENGYLYISRTFVPREGYTIVPQAVNKDGSFNQWFVIGKYVVGEILNEDGKTHNVYSSKGLKPARYINGATGTEMISDGISHTGCIDLMHRKGSYFSAGTMADYMHILTTFYLKFATKNTQSIMAGNTSNNFQYKVAVAESNTNRVILTKAQASNFEVNTCVSVGEMGSNTNNDRYYGVVHNICDNVKILSKVDIDSNNTALILDHSNFNTTLTTLVSTMHERSGYSDLILGRNGSVGSNTNGKHGMVLDGIEIAVGGYEVTGNAFLDIVNSTGKRELYYTNDSSQLTGNVTTAKSKYKKSNLSMKPTSLNSWNGVTRMEFDVKNGIALQTEIGKSGSGNSVGYADSVYIDNATSGQRELLLLGSLNNGTDAGLSCAHTYSGISTSYWHIHARLSINGVGGELAE